MAMYLSDKEVALLRTGDYVACASCTEPGPEDITVMRTQDAISKGYVDPQSLPDLAYVANEIEVYDKQGSYGHAGKYSLFPLMVINSF